MKPTKEIEQLIGDYSRFGHLLLALSVFFFLSLLIPENQKDSAQIATMIITTISFLSGAFFFYFKVIKLKEIANNDETF